MKTIKMLVALGMLAGSVAIAATATGTVMVSANVTGACNISSQPTALAFGSYNVYGTSAVTAASTFKVQCVANTPYTMRLSGGDANGVRSFTTKPTTTSVLNYTLSYNSTPWGDGATGRAQAVSIPGSSNNGSEATYTINGSIPAGQTGAAQGAYSDSITLSIDY